MRDFRKTKGRITDEGYALHCNVSMVTAAFAAGGIAAAATTVAGLGAATMAAGSVLGIKEAAPIGGLMMAGGGMAAGGAGLMAGGMGTLGTLSAGAQLVGGALQGVGILTGNSKLAGIGGLINLGGMAGSAMSTPAAGGASSVAKTAETDWGMMNTGNAAPAQAASSSGPLAGTGYDGAGAMNVKAPPAANPLESLNAKLEKYDKLVNLAGGAAKTMNENKQLNDIMAMKQNQFNQEMALQQKRNTAVAIPSVGVSAAPNPQSVRPITPSYQPGLISTGLQPTGVV